MFSSALSAEDVRGLFFIVMAIGVNVVLNFLAPDHFGRRTKPGGLGAVIFQIAITPVGIWTPPNPILVDGLLRLLREEYPRNLLQLRRTPRVAVA